MQMGYRNRHSNGWQYQFVTKQDIHNVLFICCLFVLYLMYSSGYSSNGMPSSDHESLHQSSSVYKSSSNGEYLYQFPLHSDTEPLKGIMFMAHGCSHSATDWFPKSVNCPQCMGLPEERSLVDFILSQKFVVISISSQNRMRKCWDLQSDINAVQSILSQFKKEHEIESLPLYALGASSGGQFVGFMATQSQMVSALNLKGVIIQISAIPVGLENLSQSLFTPVLFVPMDRDERTLKVVHRQIENLKQHDPASLSTVCSVKAMAIDSMYFHQRIGGKMTKEISNTIYDGLRESGYLDSDGFLKEDPRRSEWRSIVIQSVGQRVLREELEDNLKADQSAISEVMNVAFAMHELTAQCFEEMKEFMLSI